MKILNILLEDSFKFDDNNRLWTSKSGKTTSPARGGGLYQKSNGGSSTENYIPKEGDYVNLEWDGNAIAQIIEVNRDGDVVLRDVNRPKDEQDILLTAEEFKQQFYKKVEGGSNGGMWVTTKELESYLRGLGFSTARDPHTNSLETDLSPELVVYTTPDWDGKELDGFIPFEVNESEGNSVGNYIDVRSKKGDKKSQCMLVADILHSVESAYNDGGLDSVEEYINTNKYLA